MANGIMPILCQQGRSQGVLEGAEHPQLHLAEPVLK